MFAKFGELETALSKQSQINGHCPLWLEHPIKRIDPHISCAIVVLLLSGSLINLHNDV